MATYHPCRIWFEYSTKIVPIANANISLCVYNFVTFDEIFQGSMPNGLYIGVVAKLEHVYPTRVSSKKVKWRQIIIENTRQQQICCSIFGEHLDTISEIEAQFKNLKKPTMILMQVDQTIRMGRGSHPNNYKGSNEIFGESRHGTSSSIQ
ncbi:hypothetical protein RND81_06G117700 [Saponaria officinalis]|uniref:Replication protein A1 n=1 Tax=Saponaria officinalis TaxID=3572 RepID=A0AAW1KAJ9_SAPOF